MKNALLILFGESFRLGGQGTRCRGDDSSFDGQVSAALTHIKFIESLKKKNINMKVSINSYTTKFDNHLINIYNDFLINYLFYKNLIGQTNLIHNCIDKIDNINQYDFILCMRIDLFLKDNFIEIFNPYSDKILFPSICFKPRHKYGIHPRVNDMMFFIPKKYFDFIKKIQICHESWFQLIEWHKLNYDEIDTMLNTFHDSDSAKDFNPLYFIVNRPINQIHHTKDLFNKYNF